MSFSRTSLLWELEVLKDRLTQLRHSWWASARCNGRPARSSCSYNWTYCHGLFGLNRQTLDQQAATLHFSTRLSGTWVKVRAGYTPVTHYQKPSYSATINFKQSNGIIAINFLFLGQFLAGCIQYAMSQYHRYLEFLGLQALLHRAHFDRKVIDRWA